MSFNSFYFGSSISIYYYQVVAASKCKSSVVNWYWASHCSKLYFIFSGKKVDLWHCCSIEDTWDHLGFVKNCLLKICTSERALVEKWVGKISIRDNAVIKVDVRKHIVHFAEESQGIGTRFTYIFEFFRAEDHFKKLTVSIFDTVSFSDEIEQEEIVVQFLHSHVSKGFFNKIAVSFNQEKLEK